MKSKYDVVILGAGHNGLVAAAYLARAGLSVLLLEKNDYIGGATTSQKIFPDYDASLSRYSYLVSLFPEKIIQDLKLDLELRRREIASYTPYTKEGQHGGLLLSNVSDEVSRQSIIDLTGSDAEFDGLKRFYASGWCFRRAGLGHDVKAARSEGRLSSSLRSKAIPDVKPGAAWWKSRSGAQSNAICSMTWSVGWF